MKSLKVWAVMANSDQNEGRGRQYEVLYTDNKAAALHIVNHPDFYGRYGVMGTAPYNDGASDVREKELCIFTSLDDYLDSVNVEKLKQAALNKLTDKEKKLLGLV